jgi:hypothetical protein
VVLAQDCSRAHIKAPLVVINCDSCGTVVDLDLRVKPRDPEASKMRSWPARKDKIWTCRW